MEKLDYSKGELLTKEDHLKFLPLAFMDEKYKDDKKYFIKIESEEDQRTKEQNALMHPILQIIVNMNIFTKTNVKGKEISQNKEEILTAFMYNLKHLDKMILGYEYIQNGKIYKTLREDIAKSGTDYKVIRNSTTKIGKRRFKQLLDDLIKFCTANIPNMSTADNTKFADIMQDLEKKQINNSKNSTETAKLEQ